MTSDLRQKTGDLLISFGITPALKGFNFILDAVEIFKDLPNIKAMTLYSLIAEQHKTTPSRVDRAMRNAFSKVSEYHKANYFGDVKYSNMGYISIIAWRERLGNE